MFVVIASEKDVPQELEILNRLFKKGLMVYHLRKPDKSLEEHRLFLDQIDVQFHNRIVTHFFPELTDHYNLKGVHLQEQVRVDLGSELETYVEQFQENGFSVSSSFHDPKTLEDCPINFNYQLLSPVFSSISKEGYDGKGFDVLGTRKLICGMGGVNQNTIPKILKMGYQGIGVLGGIWNSKRPVEDFNLMLNLFNSCKDEN